MNEEKLKLLIKACSSGCSVKEACLYASVTDDEFIQHCKENVGFTDYCEGLKLRPVSDSLVTLAEAVKTNPDFALKYLERRKKEEFSLRTEHTGAEGKDLQPILVRFIDEKKNTAI